MYIHLKKALSKKALTSLTLILLATNTFAADFGFFAAIESGDAEIDLDSSPEDLDADTSRVRLGFAFDTAGQENKLFNYRLELALERLDLELTDIGGDPTFELTGITADNSFGFRLMHNESVRLWIGPRVRVGAFSGDLDEDSSIETDLIEFGVGGVFGANFYVSPAVTLSVETGVMVSGYAGEVDYGSGFGTDDLTGGGTSLFLSGLILF